MKNIKQKDVVKFLENEIKKLKDKETFVSLEKTLDYLITKEQTFQKEWDELFDYAKSLTEEYNKKINDLGLCVTVELKHCPNACIDFHIKAIDPTIRYSYGFCDLMNYYNEEIFFDGITAEEMMDNFNKIKKAMKKEIDNEKLLDICKSIKKKIIDEKDA